jgi:DNA-binding CsgD family transcriptional regulator
MTASVHSGSDEIVDLVGAIYDAALDAALWPDVLNRIGDAVGGPEILFGVYDPATGLSNMLSPRIDPVLIGSLMDWAPRNPLLPLGAGQAPGNVFTVGDFITPDEFAATAFYHEWWHPAGYDTEPLTTNLLVDHGATGILTSHHSRHRPPFDSGQKRLFAMLAQHLVRAVALQRRVYHLTFASESALGGFDELHQAFLLVDAQARLVFVNRVGRALLEARDGLLLEAGVVSSPHADDGRNLRSLIASCGPEAGTKAGGQASLRRPSGRLPLHALVTPVGKETAVAAMPWTIMQRPAAIVLISDPEADMKARIESLRERFGLTPAEAVFALEIVKGDGRQATADRLGITLGTARSHLSKIFDKTGVTRQAELVRLLLQK